MVFEDIEGFLRDFKDFQGFLRILKDFEGFWRFFWGGFCFLVPVSIFMRGPCSHLVFSVPVSILVLICHWSPCRTFANPAKLMNEYLKQKQLLSH